MTTPLPVFTESRACTSGAHCTMCRDPQAVRWRASLASAYSLPGDDANFACPRGKPWLGDAPEPHPVTVAPPLQHSPALTSGPGRVLKLAIKAITGEEPSPTCACNKRARLMNEWGWWKCWKNRDQIAWWLGEEAKKRGHAIADHATALSLIKAAWREYRRETPKD